MDRTEHDLRAELARRVAAPPQLPHLPAAALARGRRARRRRTAAVGAGAASLLAVALLVTPGVPSLVDRQGDVAAAPVEGPPRVPLLVGQGPGEIVDWVGGVARTRAVGEVVPVADVPSGLLLLSGPDLLLLARDATSPRVLLSGLAGAVAVSDDGERAAVVVVENGRRELREVELGTGRRLRAVPLAVPLVDSHEPVHPSAYSGDAVLITLGEGPGQRAVLWEAGAEQVVGRLDGVVAAAGGADAPWSDDRRAIGGRGAFSLGDDRCRTEVQQLRDGGGSPWRLCRETFVAFSPDGEHVLSAATGTDGDELLVRDADDGDLERRFRAPEGLRAYAWESRDAVLYTTVDGGRTVVVRCAVDSGRCATAASFPWTDRIPQPVRRTG